MGGCTAVGLVHGKKLTFGASRGMSAADLGMQISLLSSMRRVPASGKLHVAWGRADIMLCCEAKG